jgi:hypothetical protein
MSKDSYLRMDRLIQIAKDTGAQVIIVESLATYVDFRLPSSCLTIRLFIRGTDSCLRIRSSLIWSKRLG